MGNRRILTKMAQSTAEYATMIMIILVLISVMQTFLKRAQQASIRKVTRDMITVGVNNGIFDGTLQFEPAYQRSEMHLAKHSTGFEEIKGKGITHRYSYSSSQLASGASSYEKVLSYDQTANIANWGWDVKISGAGGNNNNNGAGGNNNNNGGGNGNNGGGGGIQMLP